MSFRNTAILAVLVALLGAYLYWVERPALEEASRTVSLLEFEPRAVTRLELRTPDETIEAERTDDVWRITAPIAAAGDSRAIDTLVRTAAEAEVKRTVAESVDDPAPFGLEEPVAVLQLFIGERALPTLSIGNGTPIGFNAYVRRDEEPSVLLTGGTVRAALMKRLADLREKVLLHLDETAVTAVTLAPRDGDLVRLERDGDGWRLTSPIESAAADTAVRNLLGSLRALRAVDFLAETGDEAEASRGLRPAALEITIETQAGSPPTVLRIGGEVDMGDKTLVAAALDGDEQIYAVASHVPASLGKTAAELRDKTVLAVEPDALTELHVRHRDGETFRLLRREETWTLADEPEAKTDYLVAQRFVDDLVALEGDQIASEEGDLAAVGLDDPDLEIDLIDGRGETLATVVARRDADHGDTATFYAAARGDGPVYTVRDYVYARIDKRPADLVTSAPDAPITD